MFKKAQGFEYSTQALMTKNQNPKQYDLEEQTVLKI